jgi:hypothetical protein
LTRNFGNGRTVYLPWLPEWLYFRDGLPEHRELIAQLIGQASTPPVKLVGAGPVELAIRAKPSGERVIFIVNYAGQRQSAYEEPPAISGLRLGILGGQGQARSLVSGSTVAAGPVDPHGYAWLDVPDVKHFEVILLPAPANE